MKLSAAHRLLAAEDWWTSLTSEQKKQYIEDHPGSKYAKEHIEEKPVETVEPKESPDLKGTSSVLRRHSSKIAQKLKQTFPSMHHATSGLKHLATGKPLEEQQKEALTELGILALNTGLSRSFGVWHALAISQVGYTAITHALQHYKERKKQAPQKDDVEIFVDAVAEGLEQEPRKVDKEEFKSFYKKVLHQQIKPKIKHVVQVIDKSFSDVKPAVQGLNALRKGEELAEHHKEAIKSLGKFAIGTAITYLPGGVFAHLGVSVGVVAVNHAIKAVRKIKFDESVLNIFVEAIVDSLEDSLLDAAAG